jgi:hypothetical protein
MIDPYLTEWTRPTSSEVAGIVLGVAAVVLLTRFAWHS